MMNRFDGHGWGMGLGMGWWWIIGLIIVAIVVWIVVKGIKQNNNSNTQFGNRSALDILKERYAWGEIDKQEFEERKNNLK